MALATYEFYKSVWGGDSITATAFNSYMKKAEFKLNEITFNNIDDKAREKYARELSYAICALVDCMYNYDVATANVNDPQKGSIKSISSGGESVSFGSNDTIYTATMADEKLKYGVYRNAVTPFLATTGLLYAGL